MSAKLRGALAALFFLIALGLAGTDDYEQAKMVERHICEVNPNPEWCPK